jgi:hypothetical protein
MKELGVVQGSRSGSFSGINGQKVHKRDCGYRKYLRVYRY